MADIVTLGDVSSSDKGSGTKLKTGGRRQHNMPKKCVEMKIKGGMSRAAAVKACYPQGSKAKSMTESIKDELNPRKTMKAKPINKRKTTAAERKHLLSGRKGY